jgi:hypothetical protein
MACKSLAFHFRPMHVAGPSSINGWLSEVWDADVAISEVGGSISLHSPLPFRGCLEFVFSFCWLHTVLCHDVAEENSVPLHFLFSLVFGNQCWNNRSISYSSLISFGLILFLFLVLLTLSQCI